jgi:hypothetical protein
MYITEHSGDIQPPWSHNVADVVDVRYNLHGFINYAASKSVDADPWITVGSSNLVQNNLRANYAVYVPPVTALPLTLPGATALWEANSVTGANLSLPSILPDQGSHGWNLVASTNNPILHTAALNGTNSYLAFGDTAMTNGNYSATPSNEVAIVMEQLSAGSLFTFDSMSSSNRQTAYTYYGGEFLDSGPVGACVGIQTPIVGSKWLIKNYVFGGANSAIYTNGVLAVSGDGALWNASGFILGGYYGGDAAFGYLNFAEMATFSTPLASSNRTALVNYWTAKYGITH